MKIKLFIDENELIIERVYFEEDGEREITSEQISVGQALSLFPDMRNELLSYVDSLVDSLPARLEDVESLETVSSKLDKISDCVSSIVRSEQEQKEEQQEIESAPSDTVEDEEEEEPT